MKTLLEDGAVSTVDLVDLYLAQIEKHNHNGAKLNAVVSTAPRAMAMKLAQQLDDERAQKKLRGPMHGIPIIIKALKTCPAYIDTFDANAMNLRMCISHPHSEWRRPVDHLLSKVKMPQKMLLPLSY